MGILDFVNNPMIQNMQARKRSQAEIAAALKMLAPDQQVQTSVGMGTQSNQAQRDQLAATFGNSPDAASALQTIAGQRAFGPKYDAPYTDKGSGATLQRETNSGQVKEVAHPAGGDAGGGTAKFNIMHQMPDGTIRMSVNVGGRQVWADDQSPVDFHAAPVLATQQAVTDSAGNTQLVWRQLPRGGGNAPGGPAPGGPAPGGPQPNLTAPNSVLSTGPQAAAHAGDVKSAEGEAAMYNTRQTELPGAKETVRLLQAKNQQLTQRADDILNNPNLVNVVGAAPGRLLSQLPGTELANIRQNIASLQQAMSVEGLQDLRNSSKTGGGVGQVTEGEYPILQSLVSSLNENMTVGEFLKQLQRFKDRVNYVTQAATYKYGDTYNGDFKKRYPQLDTNFEQGVVPQTAAPPPGAAQPPPTAAPIAAPQGKVTQFSELP